jgi:subtilisin family serine protease
MRAHPRTRALVGVAAGATVTALFGATLAVPAAQAANPGTNGKIKVADAANKSRVVKGRYLVQTAGTPLAVGGSSSANRTTQSAAESAVRSVGAKVGTTYSDLWTGMAVTASDEQIARLANSSSVTAIYPVLTVPMPKTTVSKTKVSSELSTISAAATGYTGKGIKVGVIDTGIDYDNADLNGGTEGGTFPTTRVAYGEDFVGDNYDSDVYDPDDPSTWPNGDADPDDCAGHGTHVAGIVGANGDLDTGGALGVAPEVTFGAYRVFGCEGSTDTDTIMKALTKAQVDGMDVVNLSLGSTFDSWPSYPDAVAAANLVKAGIVVVASAGNEGDLGLFAAGSPAVGAGVISVASYEAEKIKTRAIEVNGAKYPYTSVEATAAAPVTGSVNLKVASNTLACTVPSAVPAGTGLLIKRGDCSFADKVANAVAAGAAAVVIYNNVPGMDSFTAERDGQPPFTIPAISIGGTDGENLASLIGTGSQAMTWLDFQANLTNPDGGALSTFSSAGLAADLSLVPTITAPGGKIYSTLPVEQGAHGNMSGTSMASPFVAGAAAVLLQAKSTLAKKPSSVAQLLYNTAVPVSKATEKGVTNRAEAVFRQGSGLVNLDGALGATVTASPSVLKLGEGSSHKVAVTLTNNSSQTLTYKASRVSGVSAAASTSASDPAVGTTTPLYGFGEVGFKAYSKSITIKPGKSKKVYVKISAPTKVLKGKAGMLYGGWVTFKTTGGENTVTVPFAGVRGDYQSIKVLNKFRPVIDADGNTMKLPALAYFVADGVSPEYSNGRTYTMDPSSGGYPVLLYHLDYPASDVQLKLTNTKTKKSYWAILDYSTLDENTYRVSSKSTHLYRQSRDDSYQGFIFDGGVYHKGYAYGIPNGTYTAQLRVLKPLGSSSKSSHWDTFTTPKFTIDWYE